MKADIIVKKISCEDTDKLIVFSGIADRLLRMGKTHRKIRFYFRCRISELIKIAQKIVELNHDFFLQKSNDFTKSGQKSLAADLAIDEYRLSRILSHAEILTPWGEALPMNTFLQRRSRYTETYEALIIFFVERLENDIKNPYTDEELCVHINKILTQKKLKRNSITTARKQLGIPNSENRLKYYKHGQSLVAMIRDNGCPDELMDLWREVLQKMKPEADSVKNRVMEWLQEMDQN